MLLKVSGRFFQPGFPCWEAWDGWKSSPSNPDVIFINISTGLARCSFISPSPVSAGKIPSLSGNNSELGKGDRWRVGRDPQTPSGEHPLPRGGQGRLRVHLKHQNYSLSHCQPLPGLYSLKRQDFTLCSAPKTGWSTLAALCSFLVLQIPTFLTPLPVRYIPQAGRRKRDEPHFPSLIHTVRKT